MTPEHSAIERSEEFDDLSVRAWLRLAWQGFNRWRKRYWLTRVIILLLIFSPWFAEMLHPQGLLITRLVRMSVQAMRLYSEPQVAYNLARFHRVEEVDRLRLSLRRELDSDRDGVLDAGEEARARAAGLDPEQLTCPAIHANLEQLADAAKRLGLLPPSYSVVQVYRNTWLAAQAEAERFFAPSHREIETLLATREEPLNYLEWETWKRGLIAFLGPVLDLLHPWFLLCFLGAGLLSLALKQHRPAAGASVAFLMTAGLTISIGGPFYNVWSHDAGYVLLVSGGYALLAAVAGYAGGKAAAYVRHRGKVGLGGMALIGMLVALAGATSGLCRQFWFWFEGFPVPADWPPFRMDFTRLVVGLSLAAAGTIGLYLIALKRRRSPPR